MKYKLIFSKSNPGVFLFLNRYATELQSGIETFLIKMERLAGTAEGTYAKNTGFYDEVQGTLTTLLLRAETIDDEIVAEQIVLLQERIEMRRRQEKLLQKDFSLIIG